MVLLLRLTQGDTSNTRYQVDLSDGVRAIYQNLTVTDEPIQHRYEKPGFYRVSVKAENTAGHDQATMYIRVTRESRRWASFSSWLSEYYP